MSLGPLHVEQVYEQIARRIIQDIRAGLLSPRQRLLSERELAKQDQRARGPGSRRNEVVGLVHVSPTWMPAVLLDLSQDLPA